MVVMTETLLDSRIINIDNFISNSAMSLKMDGSIVCNTEIFSEKNVRSVAMSANIARSVKEEVKHLICVESSGRKTFPVVDVVDQNHDTRLEQTETKPLSSVGKSEYYLPTVPSVCSSISFILPSVKDNIMSAVILSKWDDIMGPQTVHIWVQDREARKSDAQIASHSTTIINTCLLKAIKYVTSHTVNYAGINPTLSSSNAGDAGKSSSVLIVPELDLIAQSLVFHLQGNEVNVPYSLAVMMSYRHYNYFLHLGQLCRHWLQRMAARLHVILLKCLTSNCSFESNDQVNDWMMDLCSMTRSLRMCGLAPGNQVYMRGVLNHPLLGRVLTSHLQTFGCTVVMGISCEDVNSLILFLALFLDVEDIHCSRFVLPTENFSFHAGLFLQGLLLNEFGCRELCSIELASNPYPVTAVDLTRGVQASAVKQTPLHHVHLAHKWQMAQQEYRLCEDREMGELGRPLHESFLNPVKEGANVISSLLEDMKRLPTHLWMTYITLFRKKLNFLACSLLNLVFWMSTDNEKLECHKYLKEALDLDESDLLIVLAVAEKLQPGVYAYVMGHR